MRTAIHFLLVNVILLVLLSQYSQAQSTEFTNGVQDKRPDFYVFTNLTLYVDYQTKIENATLVIQDGKVIASGAKVPIPKGAIVEDLGGSFIYPSFIDLHTDFGLPEPTRAPFSYT
ncbi:MAG: amidohydrolase, partial [Cytophagales bacterium]|nr:amidohydrolase [Cytophagales bacterium]